MEKNIEGDISSSNEIVESLPVSGSLLAAYGLNEKALKMEPFGSGLINNTWKVTTSGNVYILQRVNQHVFRHPEDIACNIDLIAAYLKIHHPAYNFVAPVVTREGSSLVYRKEEGYFRLFPFVKGSVSKDVTETPREAYEASAQFGRFTKLLCGFDAGQLKTTIPSFHDLSLRYQQFLQSIENGNQQRVRDSAVLVKQLTAWSHIVEKYNEIKKNPAFKLRVTHHDTKISNVLFDGEDRGLCVIDLDTVMPGYFISDVGDMMRTYLSPVTEEETDLSKIHVRDAFYEAVMQGYYDEMKDELTKEEKAHFFYAGAFMIYMQAIRFLTDHLNDDVYYGARYPGHNLMRAKNQATLLELLLEKQVVMEKIFK